MKPALLPLLALASCAATGDPDGRPRSRSAELDGAGVHYVDAGAGDDVLVLVHGWASDVSFFDEQVAALSDRVRLLVVDLPGHGASDPPVAPYSMDLFARAVEAVLDDSGVVRAFLVAHSNGVPAVRQAYRRFPERVRGLVLIDGTLRRIEVTDMQRDLIEQFESPDYSEHADAIVDSLLMWVPEALQPHVRSVMLATRPEALAGGMRAAMDPEIWTEDPIAVPTLALQAQSPFWDDDYEAYVRELVPGVDYRVLEGVSHFLHMEAPERLHGPLGEFLASQDVAGF